jgi:hypothetical protein
MRATEDARWLSRVAVADRLIDLGVDRHDLLVLAALEVLEVVLQAGLPEHALALVVAAVSIWACLASHSLLARIMPATSGVGTKKIVGPSIFEASSLLQPAVEGQRPRRLVLADAACTRRIASACWSAERCSPYSSLTWKIWPWAASISAVRPSWISTSRAKRSSSTAIACRLFSAAWVAWRMRRPAASTAARSSAMWPPCSPQAARAGVGLAGQAAAQGAQLAVVLGLDLLGGGVERVGLLFVVAGLLPGVGGELIELRYVVLRERVHGLEIGPALGDVVGAERDRDVGSGIAERAGAGG